MAHAPFPFSRLAVEVGTPAGHPLPGSPRAAFKLLKGPLNANVAAAATIFRIANFFSHIAYSSVNLGLSSIPKFKRTASLGRGGIGRERADPEVQTRRFSGRCVRKGGRRARSRRARDH